MNGIKDCEIIFSNKQTYKFSSKDLAKALAYCEGKSVFGIDTPWGVISMMDREMFERVKDAVFDGPYDNGASYAGDDKQYTAQ